MTTAAERTRIIEQARVLCAQAAQKPGQAKVDYQARTILKLAEIELSKSSWNGHWIGSIRTQIGMDRKDFSLCLQIARELQNGRIKFIDSTHPSQSPVMQEILRRAKESQSAEVAK